MSYQLSWSIPQKILRLELQGELSLAEFIEIDWSVTHCLEDSEEYIILVVDAYSLKINPYGIESIRASQTYLRNRRIQHLLVVTGSKLTRLTMLLIFNLLEADLQFFENLDQVQRFIRMIRLLGASNKIVH